MDMKRVITSLGGVEDTPGILSDTCTDQELENYLQNQVVLSLGRTPITVTEVRAQELALPILDQLAVTRASIQNQINEKEAQFTETLKMQAIIGDATAIATVSQIASEINVLKAQL